MYHPLSFTSMNDSLSWNNGRKLGKLKNTSTKDENGVEPDSYRRLSPDLYLLFVIRENPVTMATGNLRRGVGWMTIAVLKFEGKRPPSLWVCPSLTGHSSTSTPCSWVWMFCSCQGSLHMCEVFLHCLNLDSCFVSALMMPRRLVISLVNLHLKLS